MRKGTSAVAPNFKDGTNSCSDSELGHGAIPGRTTEEGNNGNNIPLVEEIDAISGDSTSQKANGGGEVGDANTVPKSDSEGDSTENSFTDSNSVYEKKTRFLSPFSSGTDGKCETSTSKETVNCTGLLREFITESCSRLDKTKYDGTNFQDDVNRNLNINGRPESDSNSVVSNNKIPNSDGERDHELVMPRKDQRHDQSECAICR